MKEEVLFVSDVCVCVLACVMERERETAFVCIKVKASVFHVLVHVWHPLHTCLCLCVHVCMAARMLVLSGWP